MHAALLPHPGYVGSEYFGEQYPSGAVVNGVRHEDLQQLSFPDSSLDIVLSSDVLEHVPDAYRAHAEIYRVLRPGGRHIFTVPFREDWQDDVRAILRDGEQHLLAPPLYHGDPVRPEQGVLVWRIFGYEMLARLDRLGFRAGMHRLYQPRYGIIGGGAIVFVAQRPAA
ncbi:MAG: class I SAM-dependent methyltransferase [Acetobacteraceae bacterium]